MNFSNTKSQIRDTKLTVIILTHTIQNMSCSTSLLLFFKADVLIHSKISWDIMVNIFGLSNYVTKQD